MGVRCTALTAPPKLAECSPSKRSLMRCAGTWLFEWAGGNAIPFGNKGKRGLDVPAKDGKKKKISNLQSAIPHEDRLAYSQ